MSMDVYDGSSWRLVKELWAYDGSTWRNIQEGWVYDGTTWREFFGPCEALLSSATGSGDDTGCSEGKCDRIVDWSVSNPSGSEHIRLLTSTGGGSYVEEADNLGVSAGPRTVANCLSSGISMSVKVRLERTGTDDLACSNSNNEKTTLAACGAGS